EQEGGGAARVASVGAVPGLRWLRVARGVPGSAPRVEPRVARVAEWRLDGAGAGWRCRAAGVGGLELPGGAVREVRRSAQARRRLLRRECARRAGRRGVATLR